MLKKSKTVRAILCTLLVAGMITGCTSGDKTSKNSDSNSVVEFKQGKITKDELFDKLVKAGGMNTVITLVDTAILNELYPVTDEMKESVDAQLQKIKDYYGDNFEAVLKQNGIDSEDEYREAAFLNFQREKYVLNYIKANILTEEEIKEYYDNFEPKIKASHILITPEDESEEALGKAKNTAEELIARIEAGEDFAELAKEFSKDPGSGANGGDLGFFGKGSMVPEFEEAAYNLKVNEFTKTPVKTQFGYHIILKTDEEKKESLEEMKDKITEDLAKERISIDPILGDKALIKMREENGFKINNLEIKNKYEELVKSIEKEKTEE
ncbi:peptidylprolyl isomerase [Oceanirhabdus sp. W0125-5]|uniref:peptidylprolyl isomerase n=1 Tax=Oceanirhabdus sp. W0125-5 TaxID=2999116 RepID=UPI0022F2A511|nr:peptidylprolyl isomerase [Oceanirhabdus sp. W0125-5]WBW96773.1 peptidylprolyl isomerase [Oceanirhabdus sp. W0125-5]